MKQRIRNFCRTIRFKMLIILLAFLMVYVITVSYFLYDTLQSTQSKILSPYQDMLDLYVEQLETSLEDIDSWMRNFSGDFDVNMMAIQDEKTDRWRALRCNADRNFLRLRQAGDKREKFYSAGVRRGYRMYPGGELRRDQNQAVLGSDAKGV